MKKLPAGWAWKQMLSVSNLRGVSFGQEPGSRDCLDSVIIFCA